MADLAERQTWTFAGQPYLRWPQWVREACALNGSRLPVLRGQVVYPDEKLTLVEGNIIEHELNQ